MNMILPLLFVFLALSLTTERILKWIYSRQSRGAASDQSFLKGSLITGGILSLALRLDLIQLILNVFDPGTSFGWGRELTAMEYITLLPGVILSACLISWGAQWLRNVLGGRSTVTEDTRERHYQPAGLDIARLAIAQNDERLRGKYANIYLLLPAFYIQHGRREPCVDICIRDGNGGSLPHHLAIEFPDHREGSVRTRVIPNFKNAKPHTGRGATIVNDQSTDYMGTLGCVVTDSSSSSYALTCNHVLTDGSFESPGSIGDQADELAGGGTQRIGAWAAGIMNGQVDAALIKLDAGVPVQPNGLSTTVYPASDNDSGVTGVALTGALSGQVAGYIIHVNQPFDIDYTNQSVNMTGLISLSRDVHSNNFTTLTQEGDSGSAVYHAVNKQLVGIVVGGNAQFTFVIPMQQVLSSFPGYSLSIAQ
jgi:hypothetical protein